MGRVIEQVALQEGHALFIAKTAPEHLLKDADVCIDFSHAECVKTHVLKAIHFQKPIIIGTTGFETDLPEIKTLVENSTIGALFSPNFSLGIALFSHLLSLADSLFSSFPIYEATGVEYHHKEKQDTPSGTAKKLSERMRGNVPFTSVRGGFFPGTHSIFFSSPVDTITLTHEARSREGFAKGALEAAKWMLDKKGWWTFDEMVGALYTAHHALQK